VEDNLETVKKAEDKIQGFGRKLKEKTLNYNQILSLQRIVIKSATR